MPDSRRDFLRTVALAGAAGGLAAAARAAALPRPEAARGAAPRALDLLILGGTGFLGPATVEEALQRGHRLTLFNRGRTNAGLHPGVERISGDRDPRIGTGLSGLRDAIAAGRRWDAVIDNSGYFPRLVGASARLLATAAEAYVFVSSISVYADPSVHGIDEEAPLGVLDDPEVEEFGASFQNYGPLKAACEREVVEAFARRACIVRPGLIVGPRDGSDRFTYWPLRVRRGGEILAPGSPDDPVQYIDVRDLGAFLLRCCEQRLAGAYNVTGPPAPTTMAELLHGCKAVVGGDARFTWVPATFLAEQQIAPWMQMPVWVPPDGEAGGLLDVSIARAVAAGLTTRPLAETVAATLAWWDELPESRRASLKAGISAERERQVLDAWHARETPAP